MCVFMCVDLHKDSLKQLQVTSDFYHPDRVFHQNNNFLFIFFAGELNKKPSPSHQFFVEARIKSMFSNGNILL